MFRVLCETWDCTAASILLLRTVHSRLRSDTRIQSPNPESGSGAAFVIMNCENPEIESEWTARDRETQINGGPARIFLNPGHRQKRGETRAQGSSELSVNFLLTIHAERVITTPYSSTYNTSDERWSPPATPRLELKLNAGLEE
jgi:hypothetical protein